jgi:hypothetical protein
MRTTQDDETQTGYVGDPPGVGWVGFAAVLLGLAGAWNFIEGILAISSAHIYTDNAHYVFSDLRTWGWIVTIFGIIQAIAAFSLLNGSEWARWFGIIVASLNAIGQLMFVDAYPWWALAMFSLDILIIYALTVYAGKRLRTA